MNTFRRTVRSVGRAMVRLAERGADQAELTLKGDRDLEWSWVAASMPERPGRVLDFGPSSSPLSLIAAFRHAEVTALDLQTVKTDHTVDNIRYLTGDVTSYDFGDQKFDTIINCSTVEHVGLPDRYGGNRDSEGDLAAMRILGGLLADAGSSMILTIPVGRDGVYEPFHRVYGEKRLPKLLEGFDVTRDMYFAKDPATRKWRSVQRREALDVAGSGSFYALGLFVLKPGQ